MVSRIMLVQKCTASLSVPESVSKSDFIESSLWGSSLNPMCAIKCYISRATAQNTVSEQIKRDPSLAGRHLDGQRGEISTQLMFFNVSGVGSVSN